jgi:hypothetical protein
MTKETNSNGITVYHLNLESFHSQSILLALEYFYSGSFRKAWDTSVLLPGKEQDYDEDGKPSKARLYKEFTQLSKLLGIDDAELILYSSSSTIEKYKASILSLKSDTTQSDVVVLLADKQIYCHQPLLICRSDFFKAILKEDAMWGTPRDDHGRHFIRLEHIHSTVFEILLSWIYGETDPFKLFSSVETANVKMLIQTVVDVLAVSEELLVNPLKDICGQILCSLMHMGNALDLFVAARTYRSENLERCCLDFGK